MNRWWFLPHVVTSISYAPLTKQHHVISSLWQLQQHANIIHCDIWYVITKFSKKQPLTTCHSAVSSCHTDWDSISSFSSNNGYDKTSTRHSHHTWYSAGMYWLMISSLYWISLLSCRMLSMRSSFSAWNSVLSSAICGVHWHNHYKVTLVPSVMLPTSSFDAWNCFHTSFSFFVFPVASSWRLAYFSSSKACSSCIVDGNSHGAVCVCEYVCMYVHLPQFFATAFSFHLLFAAFSQALLLTPQVTSLVLQPFPAVQYNSLKTTGHIVTKIPGSLLQLSLCSGGHSIFVPFLSAPLYQFCCLR